MLPTDGLRCSCKTMSRLPLTIALALLVTLYVICSTEGLSQDISQRQKRSDLEWSESEVPHSVFSVRLSNQEVKPGTPIKFDIIISNPQNHYDPTTGKFTCVYPGAYYFLFQSHSSTKGYLVAFLNKNGNTVIRMTVNLDQQMSGGTVMLLNKGDYVTVEFHDSWANMYINVRRDTVFSGFLIPSY
ncbi:unnamed protein product [Lampetra fluviatilis]